MMNRDAVFALVAYDDWANDLIIEALRGLSAEQLERPLVGSFASLRATWAHLVMAEWLWYWRWQGQPPAQLPDWVEKATVEDLTRTLLEVRDLRRAALAQLDEAGFAAEGRYSNLARDKEWQVAVGEMLTHVVTHSTYHRGQITTMMRQVGGKGPATDFLLFADFARANRG